MNTRTTLVLAFLVVALGGGYFILFGKGDLEKVTVPGVLFPNVVPSNVVSLNIQDWGKRLVPEPFSVAAGEKEWELRCGAVDEGRPVPADHATVSSVVGAFCDVRPLRVYNEHPGADLSPFGLAPNQLSLVELVLRDGQRQQLRFGAEVPPSGVLVQRSGDPVIYEVDAQLRNELLLTKERFWDRRLIRVPPIRVDHLAVKSFIDGEASWVLSRELLQWFVREPFDAPGDPPRCEEFRNVLLQLSVLEYGRPGAPYTPGIDAEHPVEYEISVGSKDLATTWTLRFGKSENGVRAVIVEGESRPLRVEAKIDSYVTAGAGRYRDRRLFYSRADSISAVRVERSGQVLLDAKKGPRVFRAFPAEPQGREPLLFDDIEQVRLLRGIKELQLLDYAESVADFDPALTVMLTFGEGEADRVTMDLGPTDSEGHRAVKLTGERGGGRVAAEAVQFLERPYHAWIERTLGGVDAYFRLGRLRITDRGGRSATFFLRLVGEQPILVAGEGKEERAIPDALGSQVIQALVRFPVEKFAGETRSPEMGLEAPTLKIEWQLSPRSTERLLATVPDDAPWHSLIFGRQGDDELIPAICDKDPKLIGFVDHRQTAPFVGVLDAALR